MIFNKGGKYSLFHSYEGIVIYKELWDVMDIQIMLISKRDSDEYILYKTIFMNVLNEDDI
jgi:hypothetical protein